jgi:predicted HicB family RNase H-like nuclease
MDMANNTLKKKIEAAKEKPSRREFLVRFDLADFADLEKEATRQNLSMNKLVQIACRDMLDALSKRRTG